MKSYLIAAGIGMAALACGSVDARTVARHQQPAHRVARQDQHIACTVIGCIPVPAACGQTIGRTFSGLPTGYDVILCPPGVQAIK